MSGLRALARLLARIGGHSVLGPRGSEYVVICEPFPAIIAVPVPGTPWNIDKEFASWAPAQ